jgi:hypothetical protein
MPGGRRVGSSWRLALLVLVAGGLLASAEVELCAPLTTQYELQLPLGAGRAALVLTVPEGAPADLGVGVCALNRDGGRWQRPLAAQLVPGRHRFDVDLSPGAPLAGVPPPAAWTPLRHCSRLGVYLWSAAASRARIGVDVQVEPGTVSATAARLVSVCPGPALLAVGERYTVTAGLDPVPLDAWGGEPQVSLHITEPDGTQREVGGFLRQPMRPVDRGDREDMQPSGPLHLACRFRPRMPGRHALELRAQWPSGGSARAGLPSLLATGEPATGIVRVDAGDPRFFSIDGRPWWPIGLNLNNTYDTRSNSLLGTRLTPSRGSLTYAAILDRLALSGGDAAEVWLSSWNLALAWRDDWPGYHGLLGPNLANAERLDIILDHAWSRGIRLLLVLNNHGQAHHKHDTEWRDNLLNQANGGPCREPGEVFVHAGALAHQEQVRRYLVARYADHPAVWGWKLWSETNLSAGDPEAMRVWHAAAAERFHRLDPSGRPVTTHWSKDYTNVDHRIAALPGIDFLSVNAYRGKEDRWLEPLAKTLSDSLLDPRRGLLKLGKPVLVTEFGGRSSRPPEAYQLIDHRTGGWAALVSGHAAAPMLWWWEWVDQGNRWEPYGALRRFTAGEDLRGGDASSRLVVATAARGPLWCRAWIRPGRALGYVQERAWGERGGEIPLIDDARLRLNDNSAPGSIAVEWWDATTGQPIGKSLVVHPGGALDLRPPPFHGHLAWKAVRQP